MKGFITSFEKRLVSFGFCLSAFATSVAAFSAAPPRVSINPPNNPPNNPLSNPLSNPNVNIDQHNHSKPFKPVKPGALTVHSRALAAGIFQQPIDHAAGSAVSGQTFAQRYWVDSEYAQGANAPVIYHICGEGDATQGYFLDDNAIEWAQTLGAHLVYLEHRYYGQSLPFSDLSTEHLQYLTLDNVIADLATFQTYMMNSQGLTGPWISVGGSYSATLSAIYRLKHPELVVGALASSGPMISRIGNLVGTSEDVDSYSSTDPSDDSGARQWIYQACTTFGFWLAEGDDINSALDSPSSWLCGQLFGGAPLYNSASYNQSYDQPFITASGDAPTNILFTYGSDDVWTNLGLSQQTNTNPGIEVYMIQGAGHHFDLNAPTSDDSAAVTQARTEFVTKAEKWIQR